MKIRRTLKGPIRALSSIYNNFKTLEERMEDRSSEDVEASLCGGVV